MVLAKKIAQMLYLGLAKNLLYLKAGIDGGIYVHVGLAAYEVRNVELSSAPKRGSTKFGYRHFDKYNGDVGCGSKSLRLPEIKDIYHRFFESFDEKDLNLTRGVETLN